MGDEIKQADFAETHIFNKGLEKEEQELKEGAAKLPNTVENREKVYSQIRFNSALEAMRNDEVTPKHLENFCHAVTLHGIATFNETYSRTQPSSTISGDQKDYSEGIADTYLGAAETFKKLGIFFEKIGPVLVLPENYVRSKNDPLGNEIRFLIDMLKNGNEWTPPKLAGAIEKLEDMIKVLNKAPLEIKTTEE